MNCEIGWTCSGSDEDRQLVRFFPNVRKTDLLDNYEAAAAADDADADDDANDAKLTRTHQRSGSRQNLVGSQN